MWIHTTYKDLGRIVGKNCHWKLLSPERNDPGRRFSSDNCLKKNCRREEYWWKDCLEERFCPVKNYPEEELSLWRVVPRKNCPGKDLPRIELSRAKIISGRIASRKTIPGNNFLCVKLSRKELSRAGEFHLTTIWRRIVSEKNLARKTTSLRIAGKNWKLSRYRIVSRKNCPLKNCPRNNCHNKSKIGLCQNCLRKKLYGPENFLWQIINSQYNKSQ